MEHKQSTLASYLWMNVLKALLLIMIVQTPDMDPSQPPPGDMMIELFWPDNMDCDIDLHVKGPSGHIFYNNRSSSVLNYLRDDLGNRGDDTPGNFEVVYSRGIDPGPYTIAAHAFSANCTLPIDVVLVVSSRQSSSNKMAIILRTTKLLAHSGQEVTMVNFELANDGSIVPGSQSDITNLIATRSE